MKVIYNTPSDIQVGDSIEINGQRGRIVTHGWAIGVVHGDGDPNRPTLYQIPYIVINAKDIKRGGQR